MAHFVLVVRKQLDSVYGGPTHGTQYSMEHACVKCGTGAQQVGPLRLKRFRIPSAPIFLTIDHEFLVQKDLADRLRAAGVTTLIEAVDARAQQPMGLWQLRAEATLPPFTTATTGVVRERPCTACNRDGHYGIPHTPYRLSYSPWDERLASLAVLATYERFGTSKLREPFSDSVFAAPLLIVSEHAADIVKAAAPRDVELHRVDV